MSVGVVSENKQSIFTWSVPGSTLSKNHFVFTVVDLIKEFKEDFPLFFEYEYTDVGRPKMYFKDEMLGFIIFGAYVNKTSCRKLADWHEDNSEAVNFITNNKKPSKSTICNFIQENTLLIEAFFQYTVSFGLKLNLIDCKCISIDGTIIKAHANNFRLIHIEEIEYLENLILQYGDNYSKNSIWNKLHKFYLKKSKTTPDIDLIVEIEEMINKKSIKLLKIALSSCEKRDYVLDLLSTLKSAYDGKHTISITDPDSRWMKDKKDNIGLNYNYQVAVDSKNDMIIGQYLTQNPTDHHELLPMSYEVKINLDQNPQVIIADNAYIQDTALEYMYKNNILAIMPDRAESMKTKNRYSKSKFRYNFENDTYTCPEGAILKRQKDRNINEVPHKIYSTKQCKKCEFHDECTSSRVREITEKVHPLRLKLKTDYQSNKGQKYYKQRAPLSEGPFANLKNTQKITQLERTGIKNAEKELTIQAILHNLKKIHKS